jgi:hypothetical protein
MDLSRGLSRHQGLPYPLFPNQETKLLKRWVDS